MHADTIDEVIALMQGLDQSLPASDGVRWFNRLYLDVTLAVRSYCQTATLAAPPFLEQLDVLFANEFFDAYGAAATGGEVPACWAPLFDARDDQRLAPLQFALAGMNAHIGHDLAIAVVETCEALNVTPTDDCPQHVDYDAVNGILSQTEQQTKQWLLTGALKELDHAVAPVDDAIAIWSIDEARAAAWTRAEVLWHLRDHQALTDAYLDALDATVAMEGRALLLPRSL
jgi:Family of unknown function (DUF5995)